MMRAAWLVVISLAVAVVAQLSVLNGLHLPGGGVPDLVLVLVAALAMGSGPVNGMVIGFTAGLCLDLAPPGSELVGQYALVFCLAGWAAGRLRPVPSNSAGFLATALLMLVVAASEVLSAAVSKLLAPAAVTLGQVRVFLPATIGYDLLLCPFVLCLVMLGGLVLTESSSAVSTRGAPADPKRPRQAAKRAHTPELHLRHGTGRPGDGWLSQSRQASRPRAPLSAHPTRLRPERGVPGSASGLRRQHGRAPATAVHLRLASGRRGDGAVAPGARRPPARHPGLLAGSGRSFRPRGGDPGGSAARSHSLTAPSPVRPRRQARIRFGGHRHDGVLGAGRPTGAGTPRRPRRQARIRFGGHRHDGVLGAGPPTGAGTPRRPRRQARIRFTGDSARTTPGPRLRTGARRPATAAGRAAAVPSLKFATRQAAVSRRAPASPRFRHKPTLLDPTRPSPAVVPGGALTTSAVGSRRQQASARLHLARRPPGMLGGSGRSVLPGPRSGRASSRQPRFSYGKRSPLSLLAGNRVGRRIGGRWLARRRIGGRSGVWLIGKRTGGAR